MFHDRLDSSMSRLDFLDSLRGYAALYVVVFHVYHIPQPFLNIPNWLDSFVSNGGTGVTLFFVISGFSMALTWQRHVDSGHAYQSFYISRMFRILPLFYFWLVVSLIRDYAFKGESGLHSFPEVVSSILVLFNFYGPFQQGIVWASWSIGVEMIFYLAFPVLAGIISSSTKTAFFLLLTSLAMSYGIHETNVDFLSTISSGMGFVRHLPVFLMGVLAFYLMRNLHSIVSRISHQLLGSILLAISLLLIASIFSMRTYGLSTYYATAVCYSFLVLGMSMTTHSPLVNAGSKSFGNLSFSMYLNHPSLVYALTPFYLVIYQFIGYKALSFLACLLLTFFILLPLSKLTFIFIEKPMMRIGKLVQARAIG